jgi:ABC-type Mn2+/Zn2+ transport system ATPase subunit
MFINAHGAVFGYGTRPVVQVDELHLHAGQRLGMFGPNGSGKTTLVRGLAGLIVPMDGLVQRDSTLCIGYVQQHRAMELHWPMSAMDAAAMALSARRRLGWMGRANLAVVRRWLKALAVDDLAAESFASLSGGQQQRVLLAGALAAEPQMLILDEPTEGLDVRSRKILLRTLRDAAANGLATIMISHAIEDLAALCDDVAWIQEAEEVGQPSRVELVSVGMLAERVLALRQSA